MENEQSVATVSNSVAKPSNEAPHTLTTEETREILTPFAFEIDKSLFGLPLATPWKRGVALSIDMLCIAMLSGAPGELLALVIAITAYRLGSKKRAEQMGKVKGRKRRAVLRFMAAFILFAVLAENLPLLLNQNNNSAPVPKSNIKGVNADLSLGESIQFAGAIAVIVNKMSNNECQTLECWQQSITPSLKGLKGLTLDEDVVLDGMKSLAEETNLSIDEQQLFQAHLLAFYYDMNPKPAKAPISAQESTTANPLEVSVETSEGFNPENVAKIADKNYNPLKQSAKEQQPVYSLLEWAKGIINDLGLGFGWAAFYFTAFTALWKGQTLGKKLLKIKVLQLDGTPLSFWDSFGRYGGYGAGLATGLLGFLQIYWDPNRQAIHDKISSTVVVDLTLMTSENR